MNILPEMEDIVIVLGEYEMTKNGIAFDGTGLDIDRESFLSQHDVVYQSPAKDGYEGFPIGNGDLGAMGWTPPDKLFFQINKTNTWDDDPAEAFSAWEDSGNPDKSERFTSLRSCGQFRIEPGLPVFDWMYLENFEGRLSLADAQGSWRAEGPLGKVSCRAFVAGDPPVMVVRYEDELAEPVERRVILARWGSRVFEHWYVSLRREFLFGFENLSAGCEGDESWIIQPTRSLKFAMVCKLVGPGVDAKRFNSRETGFVLDTGRSCSFDAYLSVVTSEEADDPLARAREYVRAAAKAGRDTVYADHRKYWAGFWSESFVDLPDDYLENLWYINVYQVGSASRGNYPPPFIGSLWAWNRDVHPWGHYYHWNQQSYTWPLHASGHPELMMPYAKWKREGLKGALEAARNGHGCDGAFYSDVSDRRGRQDYCKGRRENLGATALTAIDLWRHYEYTLDREYLEEYAYPVLREVVRFYVNKLEKGDDGKYHIPEALPYESPESGMSRDTTNDLAGIRKIFPAFIKSSRELESDKELCKQAQEVLENLAPFAMTQVPEDVTIWGDLKPGDPLIAFGVMHKTGKPEHAWVERPYWNPDADMSQPRTYHTVNAQITPVFPANIVGLDDEGTELFQACRNAALCFDPVATHGHGTIPICLARLGVAEELQHILERWVADYQLFSQGLFCYFNRENSGVGKLGAGSAKVMFGNPDERVHPPSQAFVHMALEAGSIFEATINEMLLQSHNGKIRVFPAVPEDWEGRFTLHAMGAFVVTSERAAGEIKYVAIESRKGQPCCLVNPWKSQEAVRIKLEGSEETLVETADSKELSFDTELGNVYVVERVARPISSFARETISGVKNEQPKMKGQARLGMPCQF